MCLIHKRTVRTVCALDLLDVCGLIVSHLECQEPAFKETKADNVI